MDAAKLERLRSRGLVERGRSGEECVRVSIHRPGGPAPVSRESLAAEMAGWVEALRPQLGKVGGHLIPDTLSVAGQLVEAFIPVDSLEDAEDRLAEAGLRVDLVERRKIV